MPLVSIIVPVYRVEPYLDRCVESLVGQTLEDIEIILVDDGSPDNCPAMCDAWAQRDSRVKVIHKQNGGLSSARNVALKICSGEYIGFVDSDDYVEHSMFEELYHSAVQYGSEIAICAHYQVLGESAIEHLLPHTKQVYEKEEIEEHFIFPLIGKNEEENIPTLEGFIWRQLFQREFIANKRFRSEREYFAEDVVFDLEAYAQCNRISVVNQPLYYYIYNESSLSNRYREGLWQMFVKLLTMKHEVVSAHPADSSLTTRFFNGVLQMVVVALLNLGNAKGALTQRQIRAQLKTMRACTYVDEAIRAGVYKKQTLKTRLVLFCLRYRMFTLITWMLKVTR